LINDIQNTLDDYLEKIKKACEIDGYLEIKELAFILRTSRRKITNDMECGRLGRIKMGPEDSHCHIRIPEAEALGYILQFYTAKSDLPPIEESPIFSRVKRRGL
jgi:hypothetical protein